jgi:ATP-dependent protease ClpP protease subunit
MTDSIGVTDADFTPNPDRAIWIDGEINKALENRLRPKILELTSRSREPITVFIDSEGGSPAVGKRILDLLRSTNQGGVSPCRIITVAVSKAQSTAADILSAGDFAIADPRSKLLYHGTRITVPQAVTADYASRLTEALKASNHRIAALFLDKSADRFVFLFTALRAEFEAHRASAGDRILTDLDCFQEILCQRAPTSAQEVLRRAGTIWTRCYGLVTQFEENVVKSRASGEAVDAEKIMLNVSISFEYENNKADHEWSLRTGGLSKINDHFFFLDSYFQVAHGVRFATFCERWAPHVVASDPQNTMSAEEKAAKFRAYFQPFWCFFVALSHALHQAENELTAMDAFWLGLIDTVRADLAALSAS